jgi:hypothetical protein
MTYKTTDIVDALRETAHGDRPNDFDEIHRRLRQRFPNINVWDDGVNRAFKVLCDELKEEKRESDNAYHRDQREIEEALHIIDGLGETVTLDEAIEIKAAQGDLIALRWQAAMHTRQYRINEALGEGAHQAHPQFKQTPDHVWHWTGDGDMPSENAMIDWFQMTHPAEARQIEAEIEET